MSRDSVSAAGPLVPADAPAASNKDTTPATPTVGAVFFRHFGFEAGVVCRTGESSQAFRANARPMECTLDVARFQWTWGSWLPTTAWNPGRPSGAIPLRAG